jgi:hypothetical protein
MKSSAVRIIFAAALAAAFVSCRSLGSGVPLQPLKTTTPEMAQAELLDRGMKVAALRSMMRVRATVDGKTQSFSARLAVDKPARMEMTIFTPIGTTAATIWANGNEVSFVNNVEGTSWQGSAEDLAKSLAFYSADLLPIEMAMLIMGFPPARRDVNFDFAQAGLRRASIGDVVVEFEPPVFPPADVRITRGKDVVEIRHLEMLAGK